ncbi:UDP-2,4-diacetamido-2,4,6-trideoxy-beta-L-altropyranose hydrolase [Bacillus sp. Bva_UNVM-123]|uniref:UDP-2,4-diacetamido-2,4, 6-trideoxy-beta-L-altropyranose hydrolase n=1 Tax=Bacillus sp. Bva_UNVM-123 TaxID=2829798 RepID=UPI00391F5C2D
MNIIFRVDASTEIGTGHVMRCITLAHFLKEKGAEISFICTEVSGNLIEYIREKEFNVYPILEFSDFIEDAELTIAILQKNKVDLVIVDHYKIDARWERAIKESINQIKLLIVDDLANREHDCDVLLDQNYFKEFENRYNALVPVHCKKLLGPKYLLLRPEFYKTSKVENDLTERMDILIFYGGSDPTNETMKALKALDYIDTSKLNIHVVVGLSNVNHQHIEKICQKNNYHFYIQIDYLAQLMARADLALGAGGVTMWERCFLGLPSIVTIVADNQLGSTEAAAEFGAVWNMGWHEHVNIAKLVDIMNGALAHPEKLAEIGQKAKLLMQSEEKLQTHPVVEAIMEVLT